MLKTIGAYVNVALADYDESMKSHLVELLKESLREQTTKYIFEDSWEVAENKRQLRKNEEGGLELLSTETTGGTGEILEVMTVSLTVKVEES